MGPVYEEMDDALLKEAETALEIAAKNGGDWYFHQTRLLSHLGWVKHLRGDTKEARKILEEVEKKTKLQHKYNHIGKMITCGVAFFYGFITITHSVMPYALKKRTAYPQKDPGFLVDWQTTEVKST